MMNRHVEMYLFKGIKLNIPYNSFSYNTLMN